MMSLALSKIRPVRRAMLASVLTLALLGSWYGAAPAGAHDGDGEITIEEAHPSASSVHYIVKVMFDDDQHPAPEATVTARATSPDGDDGDIVDLTLDDEEEGLYQGAVTMDEPGEWTVVFSSLNPDADLEHTETRAAPDEPEEDEAEPAEPEPEVTEPAEEPEPDVAQTNPDANLTVSEGDDDSDDDPSLALLLLAFAVLAAVVAGVFWFVMKRKASSETPAGEEPSAETPAEESDSDAGDEPAGESDDSDA